MDSHHFPSFTLQELATLTSSKLSGNPEHRIYRVADLESATEEDASFLANARYLSAMKASKAGVIFIDAATPLSDGRNFLVCDDPSRAFQILLDTFRSAQDCASGFTEIHPSAVIHPSAKIGNGVTIAPHAVIDKEVSIGDHTSIGAGCYIGPQTTIGVHCTIHPQVVIREQCFIGNHVILQPGAVIGSCGFGYTTDRMGQHTKLEQIGSVVIEDDVEIGANTTIDRARFTTTRIGKGTKIDNLVQIAHGVSIGAHNLIIAQTGIAGSASTGNHVVLAGQAAVVGHVHIADKVILAARAAASKSIDEPGGRYAGAPAVPLNEHHRRHAYVKNIDKYVKRIEALEKKLADLIPPTP